MAFQVCVCIRAYIVYWACSRALSHMRLTLRKTDLGIGGSLERLLLENRHSMDHWASKGSYIPLRRDQKLLQRRCNSRHPLSVRARPCQLRLRRQPSRLPTSLNLNPNLAVISPTFHLLSIIIIGRLSSFSRSLILPCYLIYTRMFRLCDLQCM